MPIPAFTKYPSSASPTTFAADMDTMISEYAAYIAALNALAVTVDATAATASGQPALAAAQVTLATTQAGNASASATAAASSALLGGAIAWVSGTTYAVGSPRYSLINMQTYRRTTAGAGTVDPSLDATNWTLATQGEVTLTGAQTLTNKTISGAANTITADGANAVGFREIPQVSQSVAYTLILADSGKHILHPSADTTARIFTIPANASVAYPIGTALTFVNQAGAGVLTIAIANDVMRLAGVGTTGSRTLAANGIATAIKVAATEWLISGSGLT